MDFPQVLHLSELRRDPHLLGWLRRLGEQNPPLSPGNRQNYGPDRRATSRSARCRAPRC
jgi:hypothetical protein